MKELTIEEKAKAYDEALERAKKWRNAPNVDKIPTFANRIIEEIFPELQESEDEKIRKMLIRHITQERGSLSNDEVQMAISWLEKQSERKPFDYENANIQQKDFAPIQEPKFKVKYAGSEYNVFDTKDIAGVTFYGIEDEPNHIDYVKAENCDIISGYTIKENGSPYTTKPAMFSEQKPADKVKPKFHERDWVILTAGELSTTLQVVNVDANKKLYWFNDGSYLPIVDEECLRKWTIRDAKDGDLIYVSTEEKGVQAIFHEYKNETIFFHCYLCSDFGLGGYMPIGDVELVCPLQKNLYKSFFAKMKESGCKWDGQSKKMLRNDVGL